MSIADSVRFAVVTSRITDDLNRSDLTTQIQQNLLLAIEHYKNERTWFNETNQSLTATPGQGFVSAPSDILEIDHFYLTISGKNIELMARDLNAVIEFRPTTRGRPRAYCYYQNRFELDRLPDTAYTMPLYYVKQFAVDDSTWLTQCEDLIVFHAEKMIYSNVIKDMEKAASAGTLEMGALTRLRSRSIARTTTGYTKAHYL